MLIITRLEAEQVLDCLRQAREEELMPEEFDEAIDIMEGVLELVDLPTDALVT